MKIQIDIVTGFLGSGKTTFINGLLEHKITAETILIIQCESGIVKIDNALRPESQIHVVQTGNNQPLSHSYLNRLISQYHPRRIIIEHNGMSPLPDLLNLVEEPGLSRTCTVDRVFHIIDPAAFESLINNLGSVLMEQIKHSDLILVRRDKDLSQEKAKEINGMIKSLNHHAAIYTLASPQDYGEIVNSKRAAPPQLKLFTKPGDYVFLGLLGLAALYFSYNIWGPLDVDLADLKIFNTIFLSILVQAFPFILLGVFISSLIQVFISSESIVKFFPRHKAGAFTAAIFSGFFLPVCDCAIVPVTSRLVKKGVPLPMAMTFMLAAPIVNPIVIASTLYAFPGQPMISICRVLFGLLIALGVGLILMLVPENKSALLRGARLAACDCGCCDLEDGTEKTLSLRQKMNSVFLHTANEFFDVGKFLVIGAFISTLVQTVVPKHLLASLAGGDALSLAVMMAAAFIFSICSTSDAFIAKSFSVQFPLSSIMGYLVLGPMIDIKNLLMLLGSFRKGFILKLMLLIFGVSFVVLYGFTRWLF